MKYYLTAPDYNLIIKLVLGIFLSAILLVVLYFVLRWFSKSSIFMGRSSYMRVVDRISLSKDSYLALIEMAGKIFAVCVTNDGARLISSFELSEILEKPVGAASSGVRPSDGGTFLSRFITNLKNGGVPANNGGTRTESGGDGGYEFSGEAANTFDRYFRSAAGEPGEDGDARAAAAGDVSSAACEDGDTVSELIDRISERKVLYFEKRKRR